MVVFSASGQSNGAHLCVSLRCTVQANVPFPSHIFQWNASEREGWTSMGLWNTALAEHWREGQQEILQIGAESRQNQDQARREEL